MSVVDNMRYNILRKLVIIASLSTHVRARINYQQVLHVMVAGFLFFYFCCRFPHQLFAIGVWVGGGVGRFTCEFSHTSISHGP